MVIHVKDEKTDWLVREFARRRGIGLTEAIRTAVEEASARESEEIEALRRRLEPLISQVRSRRTFGFEESQAAIDDMWGRE